MKKNKNEIIFRKLKGDKDFFCPGCGAFLKKTGICLRSTREFKVKVLLRENEKGICYTTKSVFDLNKNVLKGKLLLQALYCCKCKKTLLLKQKDVIRILKS